MRSNWHAKRLTPEEERSLVLAMHQGDTSARNQLVTAQVGIIHLCVKTFVASNHQDFDDLVQVVTLHLLRKAHLFDLSHDTKFATWVRKVAHTCICNYFRSRNRTPMHAGIKDHYAIDIDVIGKEKVDFADEWEKVRHWLDRQPESREKTVVDLRLSGYSLGDIGQEMGMSKQVAFLHLKRAIEKARQWLYPDYDGSLSSSYSLLR